MPLYHFHLADGSRQSDPHGVELPGIEAAQLEAVRYAGELLKHEPQTLWAQGQWRVEVTDDDNVLLCTVITLAIDAPSPKRQTGTVGQPKSSHPEQVPSSQTELAAE